MTNVTMTASDLARSTARFAAAALDGALGGNGYATAMALDDVWYVVTTGTGEGVDFAYDPEDVGPINANTWDYSAWCAEGGMPTSEVTTAVAYYLATGRHLGHAGACTPILSDAQTEILDIVRRLGL